MNIKLNKPTKIKLELTNGVPHITAKISINSRILSVTENSNYLSPEIFHQIEASTNEYLENLINDYFYKTSKVFESDIAGLGKYAVKYFLTWQDWEQYNWLDHYKDSTFSVTVDTTVKSSYLLM